MREWKPFHPDCLLQSRTRWLSRDPALLNKTISVRRMPAEVCWRPAFTLRVSPAHLHNPCDTAINNSAVICISVPEIEDRHARKHCPAGDVNRLNRGYAWGFLRFNCSQAECAYSVLSPSSNPNPCLKPRLEQKAIGKPDFSCSCSFYQLQWKQRQKNSLGICLKKVWREIKA